MVDKTEPITRDDLEASFRNFRGEAETTARDSAAKILPVVVGGALLVVGVAYLLGRRVGATKSTVVEIRRI